MSRRRRRGSFLVAILAGSLLSLISLLDPIHGATILPSTLHCSSTVFLHKTNTEEGPLITFEQTRLEEYQVDEYLDLNLGRSSLSVFDVNANKHVIYYNHISPCEKRPERQLIVYDPIDQTCRGLQISEWMLSEMRLLMIGLRSSLDSGLERARVDVPIGPSGMLYMIEDSLDEYLYMGRIFSSSRLTLVDVFRKSGVYHTAISSNLVTVIVQVASCGTSNLLPNDPLSKLYDTAHELGTDPSASINIVMVGACEMVSESDEDESIERASPHNLNKDPRADLQVAEETFCKRERTLFVVHYNLVARYSPGTLVGSTLEELSESRYDFQREPMMMPTGIGCRGDNEASARWQKRLTRDNPMSQFSAEFVTDFGPRGVSFMAFDQQRGLVRLDRNGRKSVYDLLQGKSYHVGEFKEPHEVLTMKQCRANQSQLGFEETIGRCMALDLSPSSQLVPSKSVTFQLLGLKANSADEHYLGSRMIDHVDYEVFERELKAEDGHEPVIVQCSKIRVTQEDERHMLVYYAQSIAHASRPTNESLAAMEKEPLILSYIELWRFDPTSKSRRLLNRVKLTEFSWQLDVEPTNDPGSQQAGDNLSVRLFDFEQCHQERSAQAEILVDFKRDDKTPVTRELLRNLDRNRHAIAETIHGMLAHTLEISALNIVDFKMKRLENGDLLTSSRIVGLHSGLSDNQLLGNGLLFASDTFKDALLKVFQNRYSLEECQLDSISWPGPHWVAFCPKISLCLIVKREDYMRPGLEQGSKNKEDLEKEDNCIVYSFRYSNFRPTRSSVHAADVSSLYLSRRNLLFDLDNGRELTDGNKSVSTYMASPKLREFKELDAIGARLTNGASLLDGIRYTTPQDMPNARNFNSRVHIPRESQLGTFRFCQLACQMDDLCGSFSVCRRHQKPNKFGSCDDDCVLSSVRLSAERVDELAHSSSLARNEEKFLLHVDDGYDQQQLVMMHDDACTLHPKDFVAEYENTKTFIQLGESQQYEVKRLKADKSKLEKRHLSLDDCAALSYERNIRVEPREANFTYCPLDSHCIVLGDDQKAHRDEMNGYCHVYKRRLTRSYEVRRMVHMVLTRRDKPSEGPESESDKKDKSSSALEKLDPVAVAARMEEEKLAKKLWGLDEQSCAQECNLRRSHCLAFDSCRQGVRELCVLFTVRSPLAKTSTYLPQLALERDTVRDHNVALLNSLVCDHYHLKPDYLEVRLKHLLELEGAAGGANAQVDLSEKNEDRDKLLEEREKVIAAEDEEQSKQQAGQLELELESESLEIIPYAQDKSHSNKWFHLGALLLGLLLGAVGTTYKQQIALGIATGYASYQSWRAQRADNDRMTHSARVSGGGAEG